MSDVPILINFVAEQLINHKELEISDIDFLKYILTFCDPQIDGSNITSRLFSVFNSLGAIIAAPVERLSEIDGISARTIKVLKFMNEFDRRSKRSQLPDRIRISRRDQLHSYFHAHLANEHVEHFHVLFLDADCRLLRDERFGQGCVDRVAVYPRQIIARALQLGASRLILAHNHPSARAAPSVEDVQLTHRLSAAGGRLGISVEDHVIIAGNDYISLRELGMIEAVAA